MATGIGDKIFGGGFRSGHEEGPKNIADDNLFSDCSVVKPDVPRVDASMGRGTSG